MIALLFAATLSTTALAAAPADGETAAKPIYYTLTPALVGNYGSGERLKYYKADVALRVATAEAQAKVEHHEPLIRNQLILLFAEQTDASLSSVEAKETLRQEALKQVRDVLEQEEGTPLVDDLLFNNLIIQ
ncbi:flagellar basal body-associated protein FliL [Stutzerimonas azotifigens]|uniref:flagellar basal body-associated protein FliL n=1 Tax=Stutzerimonas azotifigens TaxID=291995 RepID=UPI0038B693FA